MSERLTITEPEKYALDHFLERETDEQEIKISPIISFEELIQLLSDQEKEIINKLREIDPKEFGFKGERVEIESKPPNLVAVEGQKIFRDNKEYVHSTQYLPRHVFTAFDQLRQAFENENPERRLLVESGYRSPTFQIVTLVFWLKQHKFDLSRTMRQVAMPEYSQHCSVSQTALDIMNIEGVPTDERPMYFKDTAEYAWLKGKADQFNFVESYAENNSSGIQWEPWHWQYTGQG